MEFHMEFHMEPELPEATPQHPELCRSLGIWASLGWEFPSHKDCTPMEFYTESELPEATSQHPELSKSLEMRSLDWEFPSHPTGAVPIQESLPDWKYHLFLKD